MRTKIKHLSGFTLIEILVVIALLGLIASILLASLSTSRAKSRDARRIADMKTVATALELFYAIHGYYPKKDNSINISGNWDVLIDDLEQDNLLAKAQTLPTKEASVLSDAMEMSQAILSSLSLFTRASAATIIQDPLFPKRTYSYWPSPDFQNYRIRALLENSSDPALKSSYAGPFFEDHAITGDRACDASLGYYCVGATSPFDPGKPVVYLYPVSPTEVSVYVYPKEIEVSVPEYGSGWHVIAYPSGDIVDSSGVHYPYLYWEGKSVAPFVEKGSGSVVKTEDVEMFVAQALLAQGLSKKESADFLEYWIPRMRTEHPYVYVYFMPQADYDDLVPMTIVPTPDTVIRVYMLFRALDTPISLTPQTFHAPERKGFTVAEWGGDRSQLF